MRGCGISMANEPHSIKIIDTEICSTRLKAEHPELFHYTSRPIYLRLRVRLRTSRGAHVSGQIDDHRWRHRCCCRESNGCGTWHSRTVAWPAYAEAVTGVSRTCSYHYEREGEQLPENVDKALVHMKGRTQAREGHRGQDRSLSHRRQHTGRRHGRAGIRQGHRGWAAVDGAVRRRKARRHDGARNPRPRVPGRRRLPSRHRGGRGTNFQNAADAEHASNAINTLESRLPPAIEDDPYAFSWNRQTSIWDKWPNAKA